MENVVLVNERDEPTGTCEKMHAHRNALLHRAFSVFILNEKGEMLLQQRALNKYHSGGLWTNACCSHPRPGEDIRTAAERRVREELGLTVQPEKLFDFVYIAEVGNGLWEHELDHVFIATAAGPIKADELEIMDTRFSTIAAIEREIAGHEERFTVWFKIAFPKVAARLKTDLPRMCS